MGAQHIREKDATEWLNTFTLSAEQLRALNHDVD
jgi:hypothetical protein